MTGTAKTQKQSLTSPVTQPQFVPLHSTTWLTCQEATPGYESSTKQNTAPQIGRSLSAINSFLLSQVSDKTTGLRRGLAQRRPAAREKRPAVNTDVLR